MRYYAGIGSRATPVDELRKLTEIASELEKKGFVLRSGGAIGADAAFESGVSDTSNKVILRPKHCTKEAEAIASKVHPMWTACDEYARKLHGRNAQIILGQSLDQPVEFVLAWTYDGATRGGTRTGLMIAKKHNIPTFNLALGEDCIKFGAFLLTL